MFTTLMQAPPPQFFEASIAIPDGAEMRTPAADATVAVPVPFSQPASLGRLK